MLPFDELSHPLVIAHRGSALLGPENTLYAFELAVQAGADVLETDVHPSADGAVMVIHDDIVDRTSNGRGTVRSLTRRELQRLDFAWHFRLPDIDGGRDPRDRQNRTETPRGERTSGDFDFPLRGRGVRIPTLEELFKRFPEKHYSIDIKEDNAAFATEVVKIIHKHDMRGRVVLGSFHAAVVALLRGAEPPLFLAADRRDGVALLVSSMAHLPASWIEPPSAYLIPHRLGPLPVATRSLIRKTHALGRRAYFWTIDDRRTMERVLERGADGIVTNRPDLLFQVRAARAPAQGTVG